MAQSLHVEKLQIDADEGKTLLFLFLLHMQIVTVLFLIAFSS